MWHPVQNLNALRVTVLQAAQEYFVYSMYTER